VAGGQRFFEERLRELLRFFDEPRFFEELFFEELFFDFVRPSADRSLFTVAAAMRFAVFVERPRFFALDLMCSY
jgi:hypothetical protein